MQKSDSTHRSDPRARRRGFTILELLIVIGILLAIMGLVLVNVLGAGEKADKKLALVQIQSFESALTQFKSEMKRWPTEEEGLAVLWSKDALTDDDDKAKWGGPYLSEPKPKDAWGNPWTYRQPSTIDGLAFDIVSMGPDGQEGTDDDISNHDDKTSADGEVDDAFKDFKESGTEPSGG
ncbi:MAG: type II secretion system major pseudopilin GspG [Phycisphaerae bacterium]|nr:type II secretion system major pseudopilin GspG [Phycisphaerae bacterium]